MGTARFGAGIRARAQTIGLARLVGVLLAALRDYVVASRGHSGARRAAHGGACAPIHDPALRPLPQGDLEEAARRLPTRLRGGGSNGGDKG